MPRVAQSERLVGREVCKKRRVLTHAGARVSLHEMSATVPPGLDDCLAWYRGDATGPSREVCASRDVFEGRLSGVLGECERLGLGGDSAFLLVAALGEIGNNSFDHNLGHWADDVGCWFGWSLGPDSLIWLADRGRGVLASLSRVVVGLSSHQVALEMAFAKVISGRQPEQRGNGLKFVRRIVNGSSARGLVAVSGRGRVAFGGLAGPLDSLREWPTAQDRGMLVVVRWSLP
jgi:hypothetical protein